MGGIRGDAGQHICKPSLRIDVVHLGGHDEAVHGGSTIAAANSRLVRAIAYARVKTDKIDAAVLARLHAVGFLPEVWVADEETLNRRRQIAERMGVLEQLVRPKGRIQAILHSNLIPKYSGHLFGKTGRKWLDSLPLPD